MRDSFVFYRSFFEALNGLSDIEKGQCFSVIADYALNSIIPEDMNAVVRVFFTMARPQIDANIQRHENGCKGGKFGNLGGRPRKNPEETPKKPQENPNTTPNVNDNVNDNLNEVYPLSNFPRGENNQIDLEEYIEGEKRKRFVKPTIDEITLYCKEINKPINPEKFWNFYESKGWKVGKTPMKNWKAAISTWSSNYSEYNSTVETSTFLNDEQTKQLASSAELTKQRLMEQAKLKFGGQKYGKQ
jgi:hypothetical protein